MQLKDKKILFLGDSITEGYGVSDLSNRYWEVFGRKVGAHVWADGIGGTRLAIQRTPEPEGTERAAAYFASRVDGMPAEADAVVVFGGTNDWGHGDAPLGQMSDREPTTFYGACHDLFLKLLNKYPLAEIVIMTPLHRGNEDALFNDHGLRNVATLGGYVDIIREVAAYYGLPVLDLYRCSGMNPEVPIIRDTYMPDSLHPNDLGHARIASRLEGFLRML